jgi:uncharacterized membrane protein
MSATSPDKSPQPIVAGRGGFPSAMRNDFGPLLLMTLLFIYGTARILQLFAGRIPSFLIVTLHVIPPALFAVFHGARAYGSRGILIFATLCLGIGALFESISLRTGFPFGHYEFTGLMGPKLNGLPILLAPAYVGMGYLSWVIAVAILCCQNEPLSGRKIFLLPLAASFVMTVWDLSMEPVWADIDHAWVWLHGGLYYGVPTSNFFGWFLTVYTFYQIFALYLRNRVIITLPIKDWRLPILFYAVSAVGNLLVTAPLSLGEVFVDASGKSWMIHDILRASRLVSIFLMMPLALIAWAKTCGAAKPFSGKVRVDNPNIHLTR